MVPAVPIGASNEKFSKFYCFEMFLFPFLERKMLNKILEPVVSIGAGASNSIENIFNNKNCFFILEMWKIRLLKNSIAHTKIERNKATVLIVKNRNKSIQIKMLINILVLYQTFLKFYTLEPWQSKALRDTILSNKLVIF